MFFTMQARSEYGCYRLYIELQDHIPKLICVDISMLRLIPHLTLVKGVGVEIPLRVSQLVRQLEAQFHHYPNVFWSKKVEGDIVDDFQYKWKYEIQHDVWRPPSQNYLVHMLYNSPN